MKCRKKIGLFGGLFDPPHIAHLILAQSVLEEFRLDSILFIPAFNPPHKKKYSSWTVRLHMLNLAIKDNRRFRISAVESRLKGKTYTIDVIKALKKEIPGQLTLIIGSDQWVDIRSWKTPEEIKQYCRVIVIPRPGYRIRRNRSARDNLQVSNTPAIELSSTMIRDLARQGRSIRYLVPTAVEKYIQKQDLYSNREIRRHDSKRLG